MNKESIGILIRQSRQKKSLSQTKLAKLIGVGKSLICDWEHGRKEPTGSKMVAVFKALDICVCNMKDLETIEDKQN